MHTESLDIDRLDSLIRHFTLRAKVFHAGLLCNSEQFRKADGFGHLHVLRRGPLTVRSKLHGTLHIDEPTLLLYAKPVDHAFVIDPHSGADLVCARLDLGSVSQSPLVRALPRLLQIRLTELPGLAPTLELLFEEAFAQRSGRRAALDRLCELLLIQLLRHVLGAHLIEGGAIAGLADERLSRALVAMHDDPRQPWGLPALAARAGMSRARFAEHFRAVVGTTPGRYLATHRLSLARSWLLQGRSLSFIAEEVGYGSTSALSRAFQAQLRMSPTQWLRSHAADC